jgi:hypothetical protein
MIVKAGLQPPVPQIMLIRIPGSVFPESLLKISKCILDLRVFKNILLSLSSGAIKAILCS